MGLPLSEKAAASRPQVPLESRLREAEAVLDALRDQEVDAVVGRQGLALLRLREVEERLRRSEARYRGIVEDQVELICRWTPDGGLTFANEAYCRYLGLPRDALLGRPPNLCVPPEDAQRLELHLAGLHPERPVAFLEHRIVTRAGVRWLHRTDRIIADRSGHTFEYQSVCLDVTDRVAAEQELRRLNAELEKRVADRTDELQRRAIQLEELALRLTEAEASERRHMAQLLHDHLQQLLVGLRMRHCRLRKRVEDPSLRSEIEAADALVAEALESSRTLTFDLTPPALHKDNLPTALAWLGEWMHERHGLAVAIEAVELPDPGDQRLRSFLFQSARELLFNVVKHAGVLEARIALGTAASGQIELAVEDDGSGIAPDRRDLAPSGFGLATIRERLELLGGSLEIVSAPGAGTRVRIRCPVVTNSRPGAGTA